MKINNPKAINIFLTERFDTYMLIAFDSDGDDHTFVNFPSKLHHAAIVTRVRDLADQSYPQQEITTEE